MLEGGSEGSGNNCKCQFAIETLKRKKRRIIITYFFNQNILHLVFFYFPMPLFVYPIIQLNWIFNKWSTVLLMLIGIRDTATNYYYYYTIGTNSIDTCTQLSLYKQMLFAVNNNFRLFCGWNFNSNL